MIKFLKLFTTVFIVLLSMTSNTICKANVNGCNVGIIIKDSYCSNNCPMILQNGFIYRLYNADSWTLLDRFDRDLSSIKGY